MRKSPKDNMNPFVNSSNITGGSGRHWTNDKSNLKGDNSIRGESDSVKTVCPDQRKESTPVEEGGVRETYTAFPRRTGVVGNLLTKREEYEVQGGVNSGGFLPKKSRKG